MRADQVIQAEDRRYHPRIQLVPLPLWGKNLRAFMTRKEWACLRTALLEKQGVVCSTCGKVETASRRIYAHEEWEYVDQKRSGVARLSGVSLVCWHCHACEHWGCTNSLVGGGDLARRAIDDTVAHFCRVNQASKEEFRAHEAEASKDWGRRRELRWRIDYGPFERWVVTTFERDPLNGRDWSRGQLRWREEQCTPSLTEIVAGLGALAP